MSKLVQDKEGKHYLILSAEEARATGRSHEALEFKTEEQALAFVKSVSPVPDPEHPQQNKTQQTQNKPH